jgi:hypothetical protein
MPFFTDYNPDGLARQVLNDIGHDVLPKDVHKDMTVGWKEEKLKIPEEAGIIFTKKIRFHYEFEYQK